MSGYQTMSTVTTEAAAGDFVIVKCTEGKGYDAPAYAAQIAAVRASSAKAAAFHYAWPENGWQADFDHFVAKAGLQVGEAGMLDFEPWAKGQPNADPATFPAYVVGWADAFKGRFGVDPPFYAPDYFVSSIRSHATSQQWSRISILPFWKAGKGGVYVTDPTVGPGDALGFTTLALWQWTDTPLDRDVLLVPWSTFAVTKV